MTAFRSAPALVVLHTLRISGRTPTAALPELTGLTPAVIEDELAAASGDGDVVQHEGVVAGWSLTINGRHRHLDLLDRERTSARRGAEILAAYDDFMAMNDWFKHLCTEWQLQNHPRTCVDRLDDAHPRVDAVAHRLADALTRFGPYAVRFRAALDRLRAGDFTAFTTPLAASYHDVWMHLHEDLLLTLGRDRSATDGT
jgi:hypothetical protein